MSVSESPGLPKSAFVPPSANAGPLRKNWYGPHRAIGTVSTRASVCISSGGLCNPIPRGSGAPQHFRKECSGGSVQYDLPGGNPEGIIILFFNYFCFQYNMHLSYLNLSIILTCRFCYM